MAAEKDGTSRLLGAWYDPNWRQNRPWLAVFWPLSLFYRLLISGRRYGYHRRWLHRYRSPVPVVVVGNIAVGGTGKTPVVVALAKALQQAGFRPGIISRGYGSQAKYYPYLVSPDSNAKEVGDEPLLIARSTLCPVVISPKRSAAIKSLLSTHDCDVLIADDGLQHYAMDRDIEIVVVDGQRLFGNQQCLPTGPLREPLSRLSSVDWVIINGGEGKQTYIDGLANNEVINMSLKPSVLISLADNHSVALEQWESSLRVHAVAGIGNPDRFFQTLRDLGFEVIEHAFADHHDFCAADLTFDDDLAVIMTEKDAVKVQPFAQNHYWYLPVSAQLDPKFYQALILKLSQINKSHTSRETLL